MFTSPEQRDHRQTQDRYKWGGHGGPARVGVLALRSRSCAGAGASQLLTLSSGGSVGTRAGDSSGWHFGAADARARASWLRCATGSALADTERNAVDAVDVNRVPARRAVVVCTGTAVVEVCASGIGEVPAVYVAEAADDPRVAQVIDRTGTERVDVRVDIAILVLPVSGVANGQLTMLAGMVYPPCLQAVTAFRAPCSTELFGAGVVVFTSVQVMHFTSQSTCCRVSERETDKHTGQDSLGSMTYLPSGSFWPAVNGPVYVPFL